MAVIRKKKYGCCFCGAISDKQKTCCNRLMQKWEVVNDKIQRVISKLGLEVRKTCSCN